MGRAELSVKNTVHPLPSNIIPPMPHLTPLDNNFAFEVQGLDIWSGLDDVQVHPSSFSFPLSLNGPKGL